MSIAMEYGPRQHRMMHFHRSRTDVGYADVTSTDELGVTLLPLPDGSASVIDLSELFAL